MRLKRTGHSLPALFSFPSLIGLNGHRVSRTPYRNQAAPWMLCITGISSYWANILGLVKEIILRCEMRDFPKGYFVPGRGSQNEESIENF
ncbi:MAG: hypothetical protein B6D68_01310 [spirochete symbiont of Stewartia floridana]|nr:MAG: hypothetical protein B6D68_01310 [spirochete symbiont of Stewartia floridana]